MDGLVGLNVPSWPTNYKHMFCLMWLSEALEFSFFDSETYNFNDNLPYDSLK